MPSTPQITYLLASHEPALLVAVEPVLLASCTRVQIVLSAEAALAAMTAPESPCLALIDARLPGLELGRLLAAVRSAVQHRFPIVLFSDTVSEELHNRIAEGVLDDLLPTGLDPVQLSLRLHMVIRAHQRERELDLLRNASEVNDLTDRLTGAYNRDTILSMLFRETDRVQRMRTTLSFVLFDVDDFGHWNSRLGSAPCDDLLVKVVERVSRLLRSYDLFGRVGKDEFLAGLPGCSTVNAVLLAERIRNEVFGVPFPAAGAAIRLSACFGIAPSQGRSPVVVLRDAEEALRLAREAGPESIQCAADAAQAQTAPVAFFSPSSGGNFLAW